MSDPAASLPPAARVAWMLLRVALLLLISPALAGPSALEQLAPTQAELDTALGEAEAAVQRAEALQEASLLLQNALGQRRASQRRLPVCEEPEITSLVARARVFGAAWRDAAQRLRVEASRVARMAARGTATAPRVRVDAVQRAARDQAASESLASLWHGTWVETAFTECGPPLRADDGLPRAPGEERPEVAVYLVGGGFFCPSMIPADGRVAVVPDVGCLSRSLCSCDPEPLLPGAVLVGS